MAVFPTNLSLQVAKLPFEAQSTWPGPGPVLRTRSSSSLVATKPHPEPVLPLGNSQETRPQSAPTLCCPKPWGNPSFSALESPGDT